MDIKIAEMNIKIVQIDINRTYQFCTFFFNFQQISIGQCGRSARPPSLS